MRLIPLALAWAAPILAAAPAPGTPKAVPGDGMVSLSWKRTGSDSIYAIYRSTTPGNTGVTPLVKGYRAAANEVTPGADSLFLADYADRTAANGTTYYYQITAFSGGVEGPRSAQVQAKPMAAPNHAITRGRFLKIMPLGNSITEGYCPGEGLQGGYRGFLIDSLRKDKYDFAFVGSHVSISQGMDNPDHEGWPVRKIEHILHGVAARAIGAYAPDLVLLEIGTNNFAWTWPSDNDPDAFLKIYDSLAAAIYAAKPDLYLLAAPIPPISAGKERDMEGYTLQNQKIKQFNAGLKDLMGAWAAKGKHAGYVAGLEAIGEADLSDGIHPSSAGYRKMAGLWIQAIRSATEAGPTRVAPAGRKVAPGPGPAGFSLDGRSGEAGAGPAWRRR